MYDVKEGECAMVASIFSAKEFNFTLVSPNYRVVQLIVKSGFVDLDKFVSLSYPICFMGNKMEHILQIKGNPTNINLSRVSKGLCVA